MLKVYKARQESGIPTGGGSGGVSSHIPFDEKAEVDPCNVSPVAVAYNSVGQEVGYHMATQHTRQAVGFLPCFLAKAQGEFRFSIGSQTNVLIRAVARSGTSRSIASIP